MHPSLTIHNPALAGRTDIAEDTPGHVHHYRVTTTFNDGHVHHFEGVTSPPIPRPEGGHYRLTKVRQR
ncbi:YmaF family protein [Kroppenstedtia eburnea]|uniref:YmaF family protein n=1 Tax=Kroppenstedtia eburnea TaxID=714067 RepID=UPI001F1ECF8E|nr:YmaF family protein [Kroppenstedtia eburnea]